MVMGWDSTETFTDCAITGADVGQGNGIMMDQLNQKRLFVYHYQLLQ